LFLEFSAAAAIRTHWRGHTFTRGIELMEAADKIAEEVGVWASRGGYTMDEVTQPSWK
jgi:hypothetical protein